MKSIKSCRATILLVTLWLLAILSLLAIGIGFRTSIDLRLVSYQIDRLKAYEIAKAGIAKALSELEKDQTPDIDTLWECGIALKYNETFDGKFRNVGTGEGYFNISYIEDLQGKININTAPKDVLKKLHSKITDEVADNIIAWRGGAGAGAVGDYSDKSYGNKKAPFDAISELLLVKGVTQEIYEGADEAGGLKESVTVYGPEQFRINVNTADQKILDVLGLVGYSENIVRYRGGNDEEITTIEGNKVFTDIEGVKQFLKSGQGGSIDDTTLENLHLENLLTFGSNYFKISSTGTLAGRKSNIHKTITCVIKRDLSSATSKTSNTEIISWVED